MKLQRLISYGTKAVKKYDMIQDGDKIAVGMSGGKDSLALLIFLAHLKNYMNYKIEIEAINIDCFSNTDFTELENKCKELNVNFTSVRTDIGNIIFNERKESNPCSLCSKMRKAALFEKAAELKCNKVALGHNKDDVIQTFFMSLFQEGRLHTFPCYKYLDRTDVTIIRPLIYAPEKDIIGFVNKYDYHKYIIKGLCPADKKTERENMNGFIKELRGKYQDIDRKIFGAIERSGIDGYKGE